MDHPLKKYSFDPASARYVISALGRVVKRAAKLGIPELTCLRSQKYRYSVTGVGEFSAIDLVVENAQLVLDGWTFLGVVEHSPEGNNVVALDNDHEQVARHNGVGPICEHCQIQRKRKQTVILEKDGETIQVGEDCLRDFAPLIKPDRLIGYLRQLISTFQHIESMQPAIGSAPPNDIAA